MGKISSETRKINQDRDWCPKETFGCHSNVMMGISPLNLSLPLCFSQSAYCCFLSRFYDCFWLCPRISGFPKSHFWTKSCSTQPTFERTEVFPPPPWPASCHASRQSCLGGETGRSRALELWGRGGESGAGRGRESLISPGEGEAELMRSICRQPF